MMCVKRREARNFEKVPLGGVRWTLYPFSDPRKSVVQGFFWLEMHEDTKRYVASCPEYQRIRNISQRNAMPLKYNLEIDLFDVWGIDFMGPFKNSHGFEHILVMVDYVSKWVEAMP
jgi:hypothetical protein